jgi:hypothetical protein
MLSRVVCLGALMCLSCSAQSGASPKTPESNVIQRMPSNLLGFDFEKKSRAVLNPQFAPRAAKPSESCGHILLKRVDPSADRGILVPTPSAKSPMPILPGLPVCPADVR